MSRSRLVVSAARYEDCDDCLAAAASEVSERLGLDGWDLSPHWLDEHRERIVLSLPHHARIEDLGFEGWVYDARDRDLGGGL